MSLFESFTDETFTVPVEFTVPLVNGTKKYTCTGHFNHFPQDVIDDIIDGINADSEDGDLGVYNKVLNGWADLKDKSGREIVFSQDNKLDMSQIVAFRTAVIKAYFKAVSGGGSRSRRKNA